MSIYAISLFFILIFSDITSPLEFISKIIISLSNYTIKYDLFYDSDKIQSLVKFSGK